MRKLAALADPEERDHEERDHEERDHEERDHEEQDHEERDHEERDHEERDHEELDHEERDLRSWLGTWGVVWHRGAGARRKGRGGKERCGRGDAEGEKRTERFTC